MPNGIYATLIFLCRTFANGFKTISQNTKRSIAIAVSFLMISLTGF
jgi:hypothetical protein